MRKQAAFVPPGGTCCPRRRGVLSAGVASAALLAVPVAQAQAPQGGRVAHGSASISATQAETRVRQASERAIIDWRSFDVGRDHRVAFDQPDARSATLNRVQSGRESTIAGRITAPGTVIIQNTHGVVFTPSSRIDVGGLVATSRTVAADRFAADGRIEIRGGEVRGARVANQGGITVREAGLAALVGGRVANSGTIVAHCGTIALASGETTTIDLAGDGMVRIAVSGDAGRADAGVETTGLIDAGGGRVLLSAGTAAGLLSSAINTSGVIRAASSDGAGGSIALVGRGAGAVRVAGALDASGATRGGSVTVTGERVVVASGARIAASGRDAGGAVRIGGDRQGRGTLRRAESTTVEAGARIEAAASAGRGGSVILWADDATRFDGAISVAGATGGGFVETSALAALEIGDAASLEIGEGGHWLIDPVNVTVDAALAASIVGQLNVGTDVTVTTSQPGGQLGNLTVNSAIVWSGAGDLTLFADNNLSISNSIAVTTSGAGSLTATAGVDTSIAGPVTSSGSGNVSFTTGRNMIVNNNITASASGAISLLTGTGNIVISSAGNDRNITVSTNSGALTMEATSGSVQMQRIAAANARNVRVFSNSGPVDISAGTGILVLGNTGASWARLGSDTSSSDITLTAPTVQVLGGSGTNAFAEVVAGPGGSITMNAGDIQVVGGTGSGSPGSVRASGGAITMQASSSIAVTSGASPGSAQALDGTSLTMRAPVQTWNGQVQSGTAVSPTGGTVTLAGSISASVQPIFNLASGSHFTLEPTGPGAVTSAYGSNLPLRVDTRGTGTIEIGAPLRADRVVLVSEERVGIGAAGQVNSIGAGDAIVIAAGRQFRNDAGASALRLGTNGPAGRWLIFLDTIGTIVGAEPAPRQFDLYDRQFNYADPARSDIATQIVALDVLPGNRIVYGEKPIITVTAETLAKVYGNAVSPGATINAPRLNDPLADVLIGGTTSTSPGAVATAPVGPYTTTPIAALTAQAIQQRYVLELVLGTLTVAPAPLTVTANDATRPYGAPNPPFGATYTGFVLGQDPSVLGGTLGFTTTATQASNAGPYAVTPGGLTSGNYAISFAPGTLTVTPAPLTVTANDATRPYGALNPPFGATYTGFVLGQDPSVLGGTLGFTTAATQASNVGGYAVTPGGLTSANYTIGFAPGTLTVTPVPLTVTASDATRPYGALNPTFGATYTGFVLGQDPSVLGGTLGFTTAATQASNVGGYAVTPGGLTSANYTIGFAPGTLTVTPVPLTVTANDATRTYGALNPPFDATFTGFVLGQDPSVLGGTLGFTTAATQASPVGAYVLTPGGLTSGNYTIAFAPSVLTVAPAPLTVRPDDATRPEGQQNPPFNVTFRGFVLGEGPGALGGTLVIVTPATPASPPGVYVVTPSGLVSTNYTITFVNGTLTVTAAGAPPPPLPGPAVPTPDVVDSVEEFRRGVQPYTPGDAGFRTTQLEAGPAVADAFRLNYSLGEVVQLAVGPPSLPSGWVPAGARPPDADPGAPGLCGGPINVGASSPQCQEITLLETYWTTIGGAAR
jgi:filamentous hemagglutinin family protein